VWGGVSGIQHLLPLLLDAGINPNTLSRLAAENPATRFCLPYKGRLEPGMDADLVLIEQGIAHTIAAEDLFYRHRHSPYVGRSLRVRVARTILGGKTVFHAGKIGSPPAGHLITPKH
jgi:allantoinase